MSCDLQNSDPSSPYPRRAIRSYVLRAGRHHPRYQAALEGGSAYLLSSIPQGVAWSRQEKRVLEIGFGMGESFLEQALHEPHVDYFGIEVHRLGVARVCFLLQEKQMDHVRVWMGDAQEALMHFPPAFFQKIQIFFPDPWPKKRHHKRRLIQASFLDRLAPVLQSGGILHMATDWAPYAEHMQMVMAGREDFSRVLPTSEGRPDRPLTKFERQGLSKGYRIEDLLFEKRDV